MMGSGFGILDSILGDKPDAMPFFSLGKVESNNDPKQMGRIKARCAKFGDKTDKPIEDIPWAQPISPLAGVVNNGLRGVEQETMDAPVAYGMWNVPKIGAFCLLGCIDGDVGKRFYVGCIHPMHMSISMPHGRYMWKDDSPIGGHRPDGPLSADEVPIEPLYSRMTEQFTAPDAGLTRRAAGTPTEPRKKNAEFMTRGADMMASAINEKQTQDKRNSPGNTTADYIPGEIFTIEKADGTPRTIICPGYGIDQAEAELAANPDTGGVNYDSHNYSWTTPGFHSFSMNDRFDNCRIRLRTTSGHQIIMDDTNERIYISTAGGQTYIEIDQVGNIDIFAEKNISTHAKGDINFYTDSTFRVQALQGIHFRTDDEFRVHALKDFHVRTEMNIRTFSLQETRMEANTNMHVSVNQGHLRIKTGTQIDMIAIDQLRLSSNAQMSFKSGARIAGDAPDIHWNSAHAFDPEEAEQAEEIQADWTTRVPDHEPWARVFMKVADSDATATDKTNTHSPEYSYTDSMVGKAGRLNKTPDTYTRNTWWLR